MKIIDTDNFGGDYPDETVIAEGIKDRRFAEVMCAALVEKFCSHHPQADRYYRVVEDDYVLQPGFRP
jgi:hypothetical protein